MVETLELGSLKIQADDEKVNRVFENILKHAIVSTPEGGDMFISTVREEDHVAVTISHQTDGLSEGDLERFFFPHIEQETEWSVLDLPLLKIIIHRHGGNVDVVMDEDNILKMRIEFPIVPADGGRE